MKELSAKVGTKVEANKVEPVEVDMEPGEICAVLELIVTDKDGNVTEHRKIKSESFVRQFLELLYVQGYGQDSETALAVEMLIKDTGGTGRLSDTNSGMFNATASSGTSTRGIVVGTDNTPPTIDDYSLVAQIAHGTGAGQLQYGAMTFGAPAAGAAMSQFRLTRPFSNGGPGAVSVSEIGLYVSDGSYNYMTIRDILGTPISIPVGQTLTVNYQIQGSI